jgi:hypothetical protein
MPRQCRSAQRCWTPANLPWQCSFKRRESFPARPSMLCNPRQASTEPTDACHHSSTETIDACHHSSREIDACHRSSMKRKEKIDAYHRSSMETIDACHRSSRSHRHRHHRRHCGDSGPRPRPSHGPCPKHRNPCPCLCHHLQARRHHSPSSANICSSLLPASQRIPCKVRK